MDLRISVLMKAPIGYVRIEVNSEDLRMQDEDGMDIGVGILVYEAYY